MNDLLPPSRRDPEGHMRGARKILRLKVEAPSSPPPKPKWLKVRLRADPKIAEVRRVLRQHRLASVCEEAACPNLPECFSDGTATFMILGDLCTRRCPFCDVAFGRPKPPDPEEPENLARAVSALRLRYVVITSVNRDDLQDGGAEQFARSIEAIRRRSPGTSIEILTPDFRKRQETALKILSQNPPDLFNHNLETVPRLYPQARPGADYRLSLRLLGAFKERFPEIPTKSGLMVGLGEEREEIVQVMRDLRAVGCEMLTIGQYLQPSPHHYPVHRYVPPEEFEALEEIALELGFKQVASGPLVRSSYRADRQARGLLSRT